MTIQKLIETKLSTALQPEILSVENESHRHNVPPNSETHFKVVCASPAFEGLPRVKRHQQVYGILAEELAGSVHALALHLYSPVEWAETKSSPTSPECLGGSK